VWPNGQLATLKQHGSRRRRPSGLWSICVSGDRCGDAVGFSLSTRRQCNAGKPKGIGSASILPRSSWYWARAAPPTVAAQTRIVSVAKIRLGSWESARAFKGIICADISEFESYMPSHAVGLHELTCVAGAERRLGLRELSLLHPPRRNPVLRAWSVVSRAPRLGECCHPGEDAIRERSDAQCVSSARSRRLSSQRSR
jgi:hypothetical protein